MRNSSLARRNNASYFLLVLPALIIFTIGIIVPMFLAVYYSLTDWDGMSAEKNFLGLANYIKLFQDAEVRDAWWFTIRFTVWNTIIQNIVALFFAMALDSGIRGQKIYRTAFFIPCLISAVIVGFIWLRMFSNVLPSLNDIFGTDINFLLFGDKKTVLSGLLMANNWQWIGYWMMIYLAGLQSIPTGLYEAAKIDGAGPVARFFNVTRPHAGPVLHRLHRRHHHRFPEGL